ncbi:hypothetical protein [Streptomyces sp. NEAU-S77]|uniref:hypothetical protein n=1 Tax=Streptomyces sp. NEAU-S77 TaxID=3411033 RepID=UPI003BA0BF56
MLGPVLAAVFVAELATEGYWRAPAPKPSPERPERPEESERPVAGRTNSAEPGGTRAATPSEQAAHDPTPSGDDAPPSDAPTKPPPPQGTTRAPAPAPTTHTPPPSQAAPTPTPTPSPTCTRFLWWCA